MNLPNFTVIGRSLRKNAFFTAINVAGLSLGMAVCALIGLLLHFEFSFDRAHASHERMYRLLTTFKYPNSPESTIDLSAIVMGPYLSQKSADIEGYARVVTAEENFLCRSEGRDAVIKKSIQADASFFEFFPYPFLFGNEKSAFAHPKNIVLTQPVAEALYGKTDPGGKTIEYTFALPTGADTTIYYTVAGVLKALPDNSHLQFDALMPLDNRAYDQMHPNSRWHGVLANTYFRLRPGAPTGEQTAAAFPELLKAEMPNSEMIGLQLQPFSDIHLGSSAINSDRNNYLKSDRKYLGALGLTALFILIVSGINFANLSTVLALKRGQEVGVRKSLGASKSNILRHFLTESLLLAAVAGVLGFVLAELFRRPFLQLLGRDIDVRFPSAVIGSFVVSTLLLGLLAGIYPALQAARYSAAQAFQQHKTVFSMKRPFVQRLVGLQFILSGILIAGSLICYLQLDFMQRKDLGYRYDQVVEINIGPGNWMRSPVMKKELSDIPGVWAVSGSDHSLGDIDGQNGVLTRNEETRKWENFPMSIIRADYNFFDLYEMKFVAGKAPTPESAQNELEYVVNEAFIRKTGWKENPVGKEIIRAGLPEQMIGRVVGVIQDVHHNNLRNAIEPICIQSSGLSSVLSIKADPAQMSAVLKQAKEVWGRHIHDRAFDYQFMDDRFAQIYAVERRLSQALFGATLLSVFIACLGLLALSAFIITQRTKEIGIRKTLGATLPSLIGLLSKDFLTLVGVSVLLSVPPAYYLMDKWLQDFAYRIPIHWSVFALTGVSALLIAFFTVSALSVRAALANPVNSLRSE